MKEKRQKMNLRVKINVVIFGIVTVLFALMPKLIMSQWMASLDNSNQPQYEGGFVYVLHDICPCPSDDDDCAGYYACGPDKANITYNLDTAPEELLDEAKVDHYFEGMIETNRHSITAMRIYLLCDICYLMAFVSLVGGVIYWNHNMAKR